MIARVRPMTKPKTKVLSRVSLFGPPPILEGEDSKAYDELLARVTGDVKPSDIFEEIWIRDVLDITWEILRYRRLKVSLIAGQIEVELVDILEPLVRPAETEEDEYNPDDEIADYVQGGDDPERELVKRWAARDPAAIKEVDELLASAGLTMDRVVAQALASEIGNIEKIDYLTTVAENRRNAALREIDRHRATLALTLRDTVREVEDAEFETIEPSKAIGSKKATSKYAA